jgi:hypothetical protein
MEFSEVTAGVGVAGTVPGSDGVIPADPELVEVAGADPLPRDTAAGEAGVSVLSCTCVVSRTFGELRP